MNKNAQRLGRLAKGVPKKFSPAEIKRRTQILKRVNDQKRQNDQAERLRP
jgi:hypothetical protein